MRYFRFLFPLPIICSIFFFLVGCKTPNLEQGGAYNPAPVTNVITGSVSDAPADVLLFSADASWKLAYTTLDTAFKIEADNNALLLQKAPDVVKTTNKIRAQAVIVAEQWASARKAYLAAPSPQGKSRIDDILAQIQQLSSTATQVVINANLK